MRSYIYLSLLIIPFIFCSNTFAQNIINLKSGESIICAQVDLHFDVIVFKEYQDSARSFKSLPRDAVHSVQYPDSPTRVIKTVTELKREMPHNKTASIGYHRFLVSSGGETAGLNGMTVAYERRFGNQFACKVSAYLTFFDGKVESGSTGIFAKIILNKPHPVRFFLGPELNIGTIRNLDLVETFFIGNVGFSIDVNKRINLSVIGGVGHYRIFTERGNDGILGFRITPSIGINY